MRYLAVFPVLFLAVLAGCGDCDPQGTYHIFLSEISNVCFFNPEQRTFTLVRVPGGYNVEGIAGDILSVDVADDCLLALEFQVIDEMDQETSVYDLSIDLDSSTLAGAGVFEFTSPGGTCRQEVVINGEKIGS